MRLSFKRLVISVVIGTILLSYTYKRQRSAVQEYSSSSSKPVSMVSRSNNTAAATKYRDHKEENTLTKIINHKQQGHHNDVRLPWSIRRTRYLPNFYTQKHANETKHYSDSTIVYLHHNKAAGTTTKNCLISLATSTKRRIGTLLSSQGRTALDRSWKSQPNRLKAHIYMGGYAFGVCNYLTYKPCSYFTILRDPYERLISSYSYCRRARRDQICSALGANNVSIREWALHQGSFFFQQLLFDPAFCTSHFMKNRTLMAMGGIAHDIVGSDRIYAAPCWFRQKVIMHNALTNNQSEMLLNFCLENLERWFAVIGLVEEYDTSLALLQGVYNVPFKKCATGTAINKSNYLNLHPMEKTTKNDTNAARKETLKQLKLELQRDPLVSKALSADVRLYKKAQEIFERQKRTYRERFGQL
ncbi:uncharacterized protein [Amphiura filiformis]|uniref:uncharacterized protein n=1 Tax=Amphiura filiformis TaxID=82378 RepID=UPI003B20C5B0